MLLLGLFTGAVADVHTQTSQPGLLLDVGITDAGVTDEVNHAVLLFALWMGMEELSQ